MTSLSAVSTTELVARLREEQALEVEETYGSLVLANSSSLGRQAQAARKANMEKRAHAVSSVDIAMTRAEQQLARLREVRSRLIHAQCIDTAAFRLDQIYRLLLSESVILTETHGDDLDHLPVQRTRASPVRFGFHATPAAATAA